MGKLYVKLKPPKMNMYRQYIFLLIYYLVIISKFKQNKIFVMYTKNLKKKSKLKQMNK